MGPWLHFLICRLHSLMRPWFTVLSECSISNLLPFKILPHMQNVLHAVPHEAWGGIEPPRIGFANRCVTTSPPGRVLIIPFLLCFRQFVEMISIFFTVVN